MISEVSLTRGGQMTTRYSGDHDAYSYFVFPALLLAESILRIKSIFTLIDMIDILNMIISIGNSLSPFFYCHYHDSGLNIRICQLINIIRMARLEFLPA